MRCLFLSALVGLDILAPPPAARAGEAPATVRVFLPADAALSIDGAQTQSTSAVRDFATPLLPTGRDFRYDLRAQWARDGKSVTIERWVTLRRPANRGGPRPAGRAPAQAASSAGNRWSPPVVRPAEVGGARDNWKPDSSDPFYPWD